MIKRIIGCTFIALAIILTIAAIGQLANLFAAIVNLFMVLTGRLESYQIGHAFGTFIYWLFHFIATIAFWTYGRKWTKKPSTKSINVEIRK